MDFEDDDPRTDPCPECETGEVQHLYTWGGMFVSAYCSDGCGWSA